MNIIMKLIFGIYMKISYFFDISLNIGRSDMKQKAKILCDPCFHIHSLLLRFSHILFFGVTTFFYVTIVFDFITHRLHHTPRSIHQATFTRCVQGFKCPYTCLFLYRKKLKMSTFLVYLYKKKPLRALKHPYTSIHPYTKFCAQILCSNSVLSFSSSSTLRADH